MIKENMKNFSVRRMCDLLLVSPSGYYAWCDRVPSLRAQQNAVLADKIKEIFDEESSRAGAKRIERRLKQQGVSAGRHRIARIMRARGWRAKAAKKFKVTTNSNHTLPVAPNLLEQDFSAQQPNQKWVSDITYIWTDEGWLYLAVVMDLYSRMIVGWSMSERMTTTLVMDALQMAIWRRNHPQSVILHSDRGSQYCSHDYQKLLRDHGFICSMSKRGDCYDNASMESWNHSFKVEAIHGEKFITRNDAKKHVFDYIDVYYNRKRLHSGLGYLSPVYFEEQKAA